MIGTAGCPVQIVTVVGVVAFKLIKVTGGISGLPTAPGSDANVLAVAVGVFVELMQIVFKNRFTGSIGVPALAPVADDGLQVGMVDGLPVPGSHRLKIVFSLWAHAVAPFRWGGGNPYWHKLQVEKIGTITAAGS
ncbi:MAG TPA: hypothetical protein DD667_09890 [Gammaproteobacteria bacterium]|nr:hypothetical protein [Gammaproteobacteria bacterium]HAU16011.1 hypothetical protein [Gammaproteobacteria bacterium]HBO93583.1 hypothetical protein [Gammaproteobacteria bacterium]